MAAFPDNPSRDFVPSPRGGSHRQALDEWFERVPGRLIVEREVACLNQRLPDLFGYHLLQVGRLGSADTLAYSRILHRVVMDDDARPPAGDYATLRGSPCAMPIESDSVDVVVLPHILEFESQPHEALRESCRVLVPNGHLVICGFNPWSLLGFWRLAKRRRAAMPWRGQFIGQNRIRDWLALLGFDVVHTDPCFFAPPFTNERLLRRLAFLERAGDKAAPFFAGVYVLVARKRVTTLTPIRPRWKPRRRLVGVSIAGPTTRAASRE